MRAAAPDGVFNYASAILNDGLLLLEFKDAIREGDGPRILRCWKVFLMYFQYAKHKNYQLEAFHLLAQVSAAASQRIAHQLTWSCVVNTRGGEGNWIFTWNITIG
jgi:L1 cell adhesion molecule like protein